MEIYNGKVYYIKVYYKVRRGRIGHDWIGLLRIGFVVVGLRVVRHVSIVLKIAGQWQGDKRYWREKQKALAAGGGNQEGCEEGLRLCEQRFLFKIITPLSEDSANIFF